VQLIEGNFHSRGLENYEYKKNSEEMFKLLEQYGSRADALRNAQTLGKRYNAKDYSNHNPCTMAYKLVAQLFDLEEDLGKEDEEAVKVS
jgi:hypothetical protein